LDERKAPRFGGGLFLCMMLAWMGHFCAIRDPFVYKQTELQGI